MKQDPQNRFHDPLELRKVGDDLWFLLRHLEYKSKQGVVYRVPKHFITDAASIPRFLWSLVGHPMDDYAESAVLHDWLYRTGNVPKEEADRLFLEAMKSQGIRWAQRWVLYCGVKFGGRLAWNSNRRKQNT